MVTVHRTQTGVRIETRMLKVLKGLAEYLDMSLGDLLEGIVLHSFAGTPPFGPETLAKIEQLKKVYDLDLIAADAHHLTDEHPLGTAATEQDPGTNPSPGGNSPEATSGAESGR